MSVNAPMKAERLQKILSRAGIASRRKAENMILKGRVSVNGQIVRQLGSKAVLGKDEIRVDGKAIEPAIKPLGFDWKIGIALLTSFAAREVFVGTMATIYSIGSTEDEQTIHDKLASARNPVTGAKVYTAATSLSLLIFYVFAMQCMSTLAVVKRETGSWKWAWIQFLYMGVLAYLGSLITYQWLA